jgi:hypothetical protein
MGDLFLRNPSAILESTALFYISILLSTPCTANARASYNTDAKTYDVLSATGRLRIRTHPCSKPMYHAAVVQNACNCHEHHEHAPRANVHVRINLTHYSYSMHGYLKLHEQHARIPQAS